MNASSGAPLDACDRALAQLQERLDGLLAAPDRASLDAHLSGCASCRDEMRRWTALAAGLEALPEADVPEGFAEAVMADLPEMLPAAEGRGHVLRWGVVVAAILSAFVAGLAMLVNEAGAEAAGQTLQPVGASFQLGGILLAQAASGLAVALSAMSSGMAATGLTSPIAVIVVFAAVNAALLAMLARFRPRESPGARRR